MEDLGNLTVLLGADLIRQLIEIDITFDDELVDYYITMLKSLVLRLAKIPHLINLNIVRITSHKCQKSDQMLYPLFTQTL